MKLSFQPILNILKKFQKWIIWVLAIIFASAILLFIYSNWYSIIINPAELDPTVTQRVQIQILTQTYDELLDKEQTWQSNTEPVQQQNIFNSDRINQ